MVLFQLPTHKEPPVIFWYFKFLSIANQYKEFFLSNIVQIKYQKLLKIKKEIVREVAWVTNLT